MFVKKVTPMVTRFGFANHLALICMFHILQEIRAERILSILSLAYLQT